MDTLDVLRKAATASAKVWSPILLMTKIITQPSHKTTQENLKLTSWLTEALLAPTMLLAWIQRQELLSTASALMLHTSRKWVLARSRFTKVRRLTVSVLSFMVTLAMASSAKYSSKERLMARRDPMVRLPAALKSSEMLLQEKERDAGVKKTQRLTHMKFKRALLSRSVERKVKSATAPPLSIMEMLLPKTSLK